MTTADEDDVRRVALGLQVEETGREGFDLRVPAGRFVESYQEYTPGRPLRIRTDLRTTPAGRTGRVRLINQAGGCRRGVGA